MNFTTKLKKFLRITKFKKNQVVSINGGPKLRLHKFIRFNNCLSESWKVEAVEFENITEEVFLHWEQPWGSKIEVISE